ncbi:MAG: MarR family transcriptional regulator [Chloroflexota bacterium]|nr:MarR family transcriptional regulator [Chloroflexota bacterium]
MQPPRTGSQAGEPGAPDARMAAWRAFLMAHARIARALEAELQAEQGMSLADYEVLLQLARADERRMRMSEIAERMVLSRSGATRVVDRLESSELVRRISCESDRRGAWAQLTDAGYLRLRGASPTHLAGVARHFWDKIPADELERLRESLESVAEGCP